MGGRDGGYILLHRASEPLVTRDYATDKTQLRGAIRLVRKIPTTHLLNSFDNRYNFCEFRMLFVAELLLIQLIIMCIARHDQQPVGYYKADSPSGTSHFNKNNDYGMIMKY